MAVPEIVLAPPARTRLPETVALPATSSSSDGVVVPMPTRPLAKTFIPEVPPPVISPEAIRSPPWISLRERLSKVKVSPASVEVAEITKSSGLALAWKYTVSVPSSSTSKVTADEAKLLVMVAAKVPFSVELETA